MLRLAVESGNADTVAALLRYGAKASEPDRNGQTSLHVAAELGLATIVDVLLLAGAHIFQVAAQ